MLQVKAIFLSIFSGSSNFLLEKFAIYNSDLIGYISKKVTVTKTQAILIKILQDTTQLLLWRNLGTEILKIWKFEN